MTNQLADEMYSDKAAIHEASVLILSGQPYEARELLADANLLQTELGEELTKQLPLYDEAAEKLNSFEHMIQEKRYDESHKISKELPDLIYPETLEIQRLSVAMFVEDIAFINVMLERLPKNHPFRLQVQNILSNPVSTTKRSSKATTAAFTAAALVALVAAGVGYVSNLNENQLEKKLSVMASETTRSQKERSNQSSKIQELEQKLAASQEELESNETKWNAERQKLKEELSDNQGSSNELSGLQAYASGNYEQAADLLSVMKPVGNYNQETIDFYKLMATYKTGQSSRDTLDTYEKKYPTSDYLGDVYYSYLMTLRNQDEYDKLKEEIKTRFANDWFVSAL